MTGDPIFVGPIQVTKDSFFCAGGSYTDFRFDCRVQYPQKFVDDGSRFKVSLTFDGKTYPNNPDTHVITDGTDLIVSFPSTALKGNLGKSVTTYLCLSLCGSICWCWCSVLSEHRDTDSKFHVTFYYGATLLAYTECTLNIVIIVCCKGIMWSVLVLGRKDNFKWSTTQQFQLLGRN